MVEAVAEFVGVAVAEAEGAGEVPPDDADADADGLFAALLELGDAAGADVPGDVAVAVPAAAALALLLLFGAAVALWCTPGTALGDGRVDAGDVVAVDPLGPAGAATAVGTPGCRTGTSGAVGGGAFGVRPTTQAKHSPPTSTAPAAVIPTWSLVLPSLARRSVRSRRPVSRTDR